MVAADRGAVRTITITVNQTKASVSASALLANAIFDATGRRLRSLPLTDDGRLPGAS
jgi:hypothetical protein